MENKTTPELKELTPEEIAAILVHKWYLSEKEKRDVGIEYAKIDYFKRYGNPWRDKNMGEDAREQMEEIMRHKWYLSEKLGYDVGRTYAALDWIKSGYAEHWRNKTGPYKNKK